MPLPGRRLYYTVLADQDEAEYSKRERRPPKPKVELRLPLKSSYEMKISKAEGPLDDIEGVSPACLLEALQSEFPARYAEQILGIAPSRAATEAMKMTLGTRNVKAALRLRGALADEAILVPPDIVADARSLSRSLSRELGEANRHKQDAMMRRLLDMARADAPKKKAPAAHGGHPAVTASGSSASAAAEESHDAHRQPDRPLTRSDMFDLLPLVNEKLVGPMGRLATHFLWPFNLERPAPPRDELPIRIPPSAFGSSEPSRGGVGGGGGKSAGSQRPTTVPVAAPVSDTDEDRKVRFSRSAAEGAPPQSWTPMLPSPRGGGSSIDDPVAPPSSVQFDAAAIGYAAVEAPFPPLLAACNLPGFAKLTKGAPPFRVTLEGVKELQASFVATLREWRRDGPGAAFHRRFSLSDYHEADTELTAPHTVKLAAALLAYLHDAHVRGRAPTTPAQRQRLVDIRTLWALQTAAYTRHALHRQVTLPTLLLSLRVATAGISSWWCARWAASPEGARILDVMDRTISALFDPGNFLSSAAELTASPAGLRILARLRRRAYDGRHRHRHDTSPLVTSLVGAAASPRARMMLHHARANTDPTEPPAAHAPAILPIANLQFMALWGAAHAPPIDVDTLRAASTALEKAEVTAALQRASSIRVQPGGPLTLAAMAEAVRTPRAGERSFGAASGHFGAASGHFGAGATSGRFGGRREAENREDDDDTGSPSAIAVLGPVGAHLMAHNTMDHSALMLLKYSENMKEKIVEMHGHNHPYPDASHGLGSLHAPRPATGPSHAHHQPLRHSHLASSAAGSTGHGGVAFSLSKLLVTKARAT